jgi:hypothetical protein
MGTFFPDITENNIQSTPNGNSDHMRFFHAIKWQQNGEK